MFFFIGMRFGLRGLKEQYDLRRYPNSQINIVKIDGKDVLIGNSSPRLGKGHS